MNRARSCKAVRSRGAKCQVWKEQQGQQRLPSHRRLGFAPSFCLLEPVLDQSLSPSRLRMQTTKQTETNLGHPGILKRMHSRSPECTCDSRYGLGKGLHPGDDGKGQAPAAQLSTLIHSLY